MPDLTMTFGFELNSSVQVGDVAYHCSPSDDSGFLTDAQSSIKLVGSITSITPWNGTQSVIVCDYTNNITPPSNGSYILFSKDNAVNIGSISGYYGLAKFSNNSTVRGEMFSAACQVFESSK